MAIHSKPSYQCLFQTDVLDPTLNTNSPTVTEQCFHSSLSDVVGCVSESSENTVVVKTSLGDIRGRVVSAPLNDMTGITVDQYLGIPFAVPPVGQLRYADPVPLDRLPSGSLTPHLCHLYPLYPHLPSRAVFDGGSGGLTPRKR